MSALNMKCCEQKVEGNYYVQANNEEECVIEVENNANSIYTQYEVYLRCVAPFLYFIPCFAEWARWLAG